MLYFHMQRTKMFMDVEDTDFEACGLKR